MNKNSTSLTIKEAMAISAALGYLRGLELNTEYNFGQREHLDEVCRGLEKVLLKRSAEEEGNDGKKAV